MKIRLDIDLISEELYDTLLAAFKDAAEKRGMNPEEWWFNEWELTATLEEKKT